MTCHRLSVSLRILAACFLAMTSGYALCADNLIDHRVAPDTGGIWSQYDRVEKGLLLAAAGSALWYGSEQRFGRTSWQSVEGYFIAQGATEVLKHATGRLRPRETDNPNQWFEGGRSFPSGHVAGTTALVTPFILEYRNDSPMIWALAALPVYQMVARVKTQAHWQTDVLACAAVGAAAGYFTHRGGPFIVRALPNGVFVGIQKQLK